jgi:hypothetical protein
VFRYFDGSALTDGRRYAILGNATRVKRIRLATIICVTLALLSAGAQALAAAGPPSAPIDAVLSAGAKRRTFTLTSPKLHTYSAHALVLALVTASGSTMGERVTRVFGDGLHWSPVVRSDGARGAAEVWEAHATGRIEGPILAHVRYAAYPASITVVAFAGPSPYVQAHASSHGLASTPAVQLEPTTGSLLWAVGRSEGESEPITPSSGPHLVYQSLDRRTHAGGWVQVTTPTSSKIAGVADKARPRRWGLAAVAVAVPGSAQAALRAKLAKAAAAAAVASTRPGCAPNSGFEVGVEDDPVFLGQQPAMSATQGFELASSVFGAHLLRLNLMWGEVRKYGWAPYDLAVQMARERCWTVQMTIMPTPTYAEGSLPSELSAKNLNLGLMASFVREIAARYVGEVQRFSIGNEPNEGKFLAPTVTLAEKLSIYDQMYMVGYRAVKAVDPSAQVIAGELSGNNIIEWLENVDKLPSEGIAIHPYGLPNQVSQFASIIYPIPLLVSEDGVQASDPNQIADDLKREEIAREGGAMEIVFYQLSRADATEGGWDTGIE